MTGKPQGQFEAILINDSIFPAYGNAFNGGTIETSKVESFSIGKLKKTSTGRRLLIDDISLFSILFICIVPL